MTTAEVKDVRGLHSAALTHLQAGVCSAFPDEETEALERGLQKAQAWLGGATGLRGPGEASEASLSKGRGHGAGPWASARRQWAGIPLPVPSP